MDLSISREAISYYENGLRCPNLEMLVKLSEYFKVSIDYLITGKISENEITSHRSDQNLQKSDYLILKIGRVNYEF